jgi:hypothetical protein
MGLFKLVDNATVQQLRLWWSSEPPDWANDPSSFLDEVAYALSESGPEGIAFLKSFLDEGTPDQRARAIHFLADKRIVDPEIIGQMIDAINERDPQLQTAAVWGLIQVDHFALSRDQAEQLRVSPNERLSASAMVYLSRAYPEESIAILSQALQSSNPRDREYACDEIGDRRIAELKDRLKGMLSDANQDVRRAAADNLELF